MAFLYSSFRWAVIWPSNPLIFLFSDLTLAILLAFLPRSLIHVAVDELESTWPTLAVSARDDCASCISVLYFRLCFLRGLQIQEWSNSSRTAEVQNRSILAWQCALYQKIKPCLPAAHDCFPKASKKFMRWHPVRNREIYCFWKIVLKKISFLMAKPFYNIILVLTVCIIDYYIWYSCCLVLWCYNVSLLLFAPCPFFFPATHSPSYTPIGYVQDPDRLWE